MINGNQKTAMALAFEKAVAEGKTPMHCDVLIVDNTVYATGPHGTAQCRADQPHEIGIIVTEVGTGNKLGQPAYRTAEAIANKMCEED